LARRQYTWFKLNDPRIHWLDAGNPKLVAQAASLVGARLGVRPPPPEADT
jgi:tRNA A37 N6-isopentenylltransferase MiaA